MQFSITPYLACFHLPELAYFSSSAGPLVIFVSIGRLTFCTFFKSHRWMK